ncbi:hypothetical protein ACHWWK_27100 [Klebsiella pneumoniae]
MIPKSSARSGRRAALNFKKPSVVSSRLFLCLIPANEQYYLPRSDEDKKSYNRFHSKPWRQMLLTFTTFWQSLSIEAFTRAAHGASRFAARAFSTTQTAEESWRATVRSQWSPYPNTSPMLAKPG